MNTSPVINKSGCKIYDFNAAVSLMDDSIREELHNRQDFKTEQEFFDAYADLHLSKYGEEWELSKINPVW